MKLGNCLIFGMLLLPAVSLADGHIPVQNCELFVYAVTSTEKVQCDGSNNQFCGTAKTATFRLGVHNSSLDGKIKRIGFMGVDTWNQSNGSHDQVLNIELGPEDSNSSGIWDMSFTLSTHIAWMNVEHRVRGAFFVETEANTFYWLKSPGGGDFEFDRNLSLDLGSYNKHCRR